MGRQNAQKQTALVTGASTGIGLELARVLASNGHPLAIVARDHEKLKTAAARLQTEYGISVRAFAKDLSEAGAAEELWSDLCESNIRALDLAPHAALEFDRTLEWLLTGEDHPKP